MATATAAGPPIRKTGSGLPSRVIMHGVEGIGKTSAFAHAPAPIFMMTRGETGLVTLIDNGQVQPTDHFEPDFRDWNTLLGPMGLQWFLENQHSYRTLILDTLNGAERLCHEYVCKRDFKGSWENFMSYGKGPEQALQDWILLLSLLDAIREQRKMSIVLLCHTKVKTFKNPAGPDFDRYTPDMNDKSWGQAHKWADVVAFCNHETFVNKERGAFKAKGESSGRRLLYTTRTAAWDAKNRLGLPEEIDMGQTSLSTWEAFYGAMKAARAAALPVKEAINGQG